MTVPLLRRVEGKAVQGCSCLFGGLHAICGPCGRTVRDSSHSVTQAFPQAAPVKVMNEYNLLRGHPSWKLTSKWFCISGLQQFITCSIISLTHSEEITMFAQLFVLVMPLCLNYLSNSKTNVHRCSFFLLRLSKIASLQQTFAGYSLVNQTVQFGRMHTDLQAAGTNCLTYGLGFLFYWRDSSSKMGVSPTIHITVLEVPQREVTLANAKC